ncbi:WD repeat-containing protein 74-like [Artemia franciscana]|uniref:WD repeat-containing protein 74 n=1 Tax=Artemia franciscana TaxID=6661 RepID=A0AA88HBA9_ARTSF|nr:hypothetical protein QYM36_017822 [Artemia franciscana]
MKHTDFNLYVGAETGILKGININNQNVIVKNFHNLKKLDKQEEICSLAWGDSEETDVLIGIRCQKVRTFDSEFNCFSSCMETLAGSGPIVGVARFEGALVTAAESGTVKVWRTREKESKAIEFESGGGGKNIARMRQNPTKPSVFAIGGQENTLRLWDLANPEKPLFKAKNVKNDFLNLRVPIWISDIAFLQDSERIATTSRHSHIRVYSPKEQLRPVIDFTFEDEPLTSLSTANKEWEVVVGSGRGRLGLFDLRQRRIVHSMKGLVGGIRDVVCHKTRPYVASVSLDRHLRIHELNTKKLLFKVYLKSRLNSILMRSSFALDETEELEIKEEMQTPVPKGDDSIEEITISDDENDDIWNNMECVSGNASKKLKYT